MIREQDIQAILCGEFQRFFRELLYTITSFTLHNRSKWYKWMILPILKMRKHEPERLRHLHKVTHGLMLEKWLQPGLLYFLSHVHKNTVYTLLPMVVATPWNIHLELRKLLLREMLTRTLIQESAAFLVRSLSSICLGMISCES